MIESLIQEFLNMGYSKEEAKELANRTREIMETCCISKDQALKAIKTILVMYT